MADSTHAPSDITKPRGPNLKPGILTLNSIFDWVSLNELIKLNSCYTSYITHILISKLRWFLYTVGDPFLHLKNVEKGTSAKNGPLAQNMGHSRISVITYNSLISFKILDM